MLKKIGSLLVALAIVSEFLLPMEQASAARGTPGSSEFGFGGELHPSGSYAEDGVRLAGNLQLDWIAIKLPWAEIQGQKGGILNWSGYETVLSSQVPVMVSITQAPTWALTDKGPDPSLTAQFVKGVISKYGKKLRAIELFPFANTKSGWGADPNPRAYVTLFKAVQDAIQPVNSSILFIAGGLMPVSAQPNSAELDDLAFLREMYKAGAAGTIHVISIGLSAVKGAPTTAPLPTEHRVLRHYEEVRDIMLQNNHERGLIWITGIHPESGSAAQQSTWISQALQQMRSQLYIGVAFIDSLNPASPAEFALIQPDGEFHPAYRVVRDQIAQNSTGSLKNRPGRPKATPLLRSR